MAVQGDEGRREQPRYGKEEIRRWVEKRRDRKRMGSEEERGELRGNEGKEEPGEGKRWSHSGTES